MSLPPAVAEMLGEDLAAAIDSAQARLSDATITARCSAGLWYVERASADVASDLTYQGCVDAVNALA
ncbi:MAG: hypothetical protein JSR98_20120 [Proteobacteria bacterium]|nr:hypothetical protein [Pseudomonadota bacterium]